MYPLQVMEQLYSKRNTLTCCIRFLLIFKDIITYLVAYNTHILFHSFVYHRVRYNVTQLGPFFRASKDQNQIISMLSFELEQLLRFYFQAHSDF